MTLLKGKPVADAITEENIAVIESIRKKYNIKRKPTLAILRVGSDENDLAYERGAKSRMEKTGIEVEVVALDADLGEEEYLKRLRGLNSRDDVDGILCFRPLPKHIDEDKVQYEISESKDVDAFNPVNLIKLIDKDESGFVPCTPKAVMEILKYYEVKVEGKRVVIIGRSNVVGKPLAFLMLNKNATVTICHTRTANLEREVKNAEILVAAAGSAEFVKGEWIGKETVVLDVGINFKDGKLVGDIDTNSIDEAVKFTPVPGGVGAVTTSVLAKSVVKVWKKKMDESFDDASDDF